MMMLVLCCIGAHAQATKDFDNKLIKIGTAQAEMVPNKWYFVYNSRNPGDAAHFVDPGGAITLTHGGVVHDGGIGNEHGKGARMTATDVLTPLSNTSGVSAANHLDKIVRFVPVDGVENVYYVQFGTGNWLSPDAITGVEGWDALRIVEPIDFELGNVGKYSFYLTKQEGVANKQGRFGWNKYNGGLANLVDNNGAGSSVAFWLSGENTALTGNNVWQIFDVVDLGEITEDVLIVQEGNALYATLGTKEQEYKNIVANAGDSYGNYRTEDVTALQQIWTVVYDKAMAVNGETAADFKEVWPTLQEMQADHEALKAAFQQVYDNKIPLAMSDIKPGYYTINTAMEYTGNNNMVPVYYTQEECDALNPTRQADGKDPLTTDSIKGTAQAIKAMYARTDDAGNTFAAWNNLQNSPRFLWKVEAVQGRPTEYSLINMHKGHKFRKSGNNYWFVDDETADTTTVKFDYIGEKQAPVTGADVTVVAIRMAYGTAEGGGNYLHQDGHSSGGGTSGWIVNWSTSTTSTDASQWYLAPVSDEEAQAWMTSNETQLASMIDKADSILNVVPEQIEIAKDSVGGVTFYSPYTHLDGRGGITKEDTYAYLSDGDPSTYWHSDWGGGVVGVHAHYLQLTTPEALDGNEYFVKLSRRPVKNNHPIKLAVRGYDEDNAQLTFDQGENLGTLQFPYSGQGQWDTSTTSFDGGGKKIFRFYWEESANETENMGQNGYMNIGDFEIVGVDFKKTIYHKDGGISQYAAREDYVKPLEAAIAAWKTDDYTADSIELYDNEEFKTAYENLVSAAEAWATVYVDPAALRRAIADAPDSKIFVTGTQPGFWPEGTTTPATAVKAANDYDKKGEYTPEGSESKIKAITDATNSIFDQAIKVQTGKWYRFSFPTEDMFDKFGWNKTRANAPKNGNSKALYGKTVFIGWDEVTFSLQDKESGEGKDTITVHSMYESLVAAGDADSYSEGDGLYFLDESEAEYSSEGEDLFRFIKATDSTYIVQNKASGLFLNGGNLSAIPSYFYVKAIGAGTNIIAYTDILGEEKSNIHAQLVANRLVAYSDRNLDSNSALMITEAGDVKEEPATAYSIKLWPGDINTLTYPVEIQVGAGATAYGAELVITENVDTAVVLKEILAETITAGTPFILIADCDKYISYSDRWDVIAADEMKKSVNNTKIHTDGNMHFGVVERHYTNQRLDEEYAVIPMNHGMAIDTTLRNFGDLKGTFRTVNVKPGKGLVANNDGFVHIKASTGQDVYAHGAYIESDFDGRSTDVLGSIKVKFEGSIDTGIDEVLNNVAKSGNIYTVDGKLVGKGNINAINRMPAGVYIINGAKVIKN